MSQFPFVKPKALTRLDQIREQISRLEALVGQLGHGLGAEALNILPMLDQITAELSELKTAGQSTPAETSRLEHASTELQRKAVAFLREVGGVHAVRIARNSRQPEPAQWWWFLDRVIAERRQARLQQWLVKGAVAVAVVALLFFIYQQFMAPDPAIVTSFRHQQTAESLATSQDWVGALGEAEQALAATPDNPDLLILQGAIQQILGDRAAAEEAFAAAEAHFDSREEFLIVRSGQFLRLNQNQPALVDAQELVAIDPTSAAGHLMLGQVYANLEAYEDAIAAFEKAGELADSQGNGELAATARIQLGMIMQMMAPPTTTAGP